MNIRSITNQILSLGNIKPKDKRKLDASTERDSNPNWEQGKGEPEKRHLTKEETDSAILKLKELPGVKENNLTVKVETKDNVTVGYVEDPTGKVIRRLTAQDLWRLTQKTNDKTGNLLNKAS